MSIWPDHMIEAAALRTNPAPIIEPFVAQGPANAVSYGLTSYGYDFRLGYDFRRMTAHRGRRGGWMDPKKKPAPREFEALYPTMEMREPFLLQRGVAIWGQSLEYFRIPRETLALIFGKSSYARLGLIVNCTPFEPEWEGYATICLINGGELPIMLYPGEGIAQITFHSPTSGQECSVSYKDKKGKYDGAKGIQTAKNS